MKVIFLTHDLDSRGGLGRLTLEALNGLLEREIDVNVLTEVNSGHPKERAILKRGKNIFTTLLAVRKIIKDADLIHSWDGNPYAITAFLAGLGLNKRHIITAPGAYSVMPLYRFATRLLTILAYKNAENIICISKYIKDEIDKVVLSAKTTVITPGVDFDKFSGERFIPKERFILGVGNLGRRKGYHISIPAFGRIAAKVPKVKYLIAGKLDTNFYKRAQELMKEYNIEDRVVFLGSLNDSELKQLYLSAELFILTSVNYGHFEGFGLVFLEAASAGLPVIGTKDNGIADAVAENINGFLVAQNDIEGTAEAILKILSNEELKKQFSDGSIKFARENNWEKMIKKYMHIYGR